MRVPLIYRKKPIFGFDIGSQTVKVVQLEKSGNKPGVVGFGHAEFPAKTIVEGIIVDPEALAQSIKSLLDSPGVGKITARRVAASLPMSKVFIRTLQLPPMSTKDLNEALKFEAEQYIPVPVTDLYLDYEIIASDEAAGHTDLLMAAAPRAIVDSYIKLFDILDLEVDSLEFGIAATARALLPPLPAGQAILVVDFGSLSTDLTIYDGGTKLTGTITGGGDTLTKTLATKLGIKPDEAEEVKHRFGVAPSGMQAKILETLKPQLQNITTEIKKVIKYYQERGEKKHPVSNLILAGGSASMPGLVEWLQKELGVTVSLGAPWQRIDLNNIEVPEDSPMYTTAIGLALREFEGVRS